VRKERKKYTLIRLATETVRGGGGKGPSRFLKPLSNGLQKGRRKNFGGRAHARQGRKKRGVGRGCFFSSSIFHLGKKDKVATLWEGGGGVVLERFVLFPAMKLRKEKKRRPRPFPFPFLPFFLRCNERKKKKKDGKKLVHPCIEGGEGKKGSSPCSSLTSHR